MLTEYDAWSKPPVAHTAAETEAARIWRVTCDQYLKNELSELAFSTWFQPVVPYYSGDNKFLLSVPNELTQEYVLKYKDLVENALALTTSRKFQLSVEVKAEAPSMIVIEKEDFSPAARRARRQKLNPEYTFDKFIVGPSNSFAHAACVAVASLEGARNYNPLFIYGGSGLGKTHIMQAIGNQVLKDHPEKKVVYVQTEQFVNEFIQVIASKKYDEFRNKYRLADFLLIDDIQFIEKKEQMQEEFFHTFNAIYESGKNIILTCDKPPQSLQTLEERLKTRIASGMTIDITPPEYETRMAILKSLAEKHSFLLTHDVLDYMAGNITSNIRELAGAFNTLMGYNNLLGEITLESARKALKDYVLPQARQKLDSQLIIHVSANYFDVSVDDILSKKRNQEIVEARHIAMYLCYELVNMTYSDIGKDFGGKNHATVMHAWEKIGNDIKEDSRTRRIVEEITLRLKP